MFQHPTRCGAATLQGRPDCQGSGQPRDRHFVPRVQHGQRVRHHHQRESVPRRAKEPRETARLLCQRCGVGCCVQQSALGTQRRLDLAYLTGQRPADVLMMRKDDVEGGFLMVQQNKTGKRLRIRVNSDGQVNSLGKLLSQIAERNARLVTSYLIVSKTGRRMTATMLRKRWDEARESARTSAMMENDSLLASKIAAFQFRDIRPKAASEIEDIGEASLLLGHTEGDITQRVYRRIGATANPSK